MKTRSEYFRDREQMKNDSKIAAKKARRNELQAFIDADEVEQAKREVAQLNSEIAIDMKRNAAEIQAVEEQIRAVRPKLLRDAYQAVRSAYVAAQEKPGFTSPERAEALRVCANELLDLDVLVEDWKPAVEKLVEKYGRDVPELNIALQEEVANV